MRTAELAALKFIGIKQKPSENVTAYLTRLTEPFGDEIPKNIENLIKAKFKKGLRKDIKNALTSSNDCHASQQCILFCFRLHVCMLGP